MNKEVQPFLLATYLHELEQLVNLDSGSYDPEGVRKIADYFAAKFQALGWQVTYRQVNEAVGPCLEITNRPDAAAYDVLLIGHMDTVFPRGTAAARPYRQVGNRAYGPGVVDMKCCLLSAFYALERLQREQRLATASICLAFNSDEELSSKYSRPWLEGLAKKSAYALVLEPARADGSLVNTRRGVGRYTIEFTGVAAHSGVAPQKGVSAIQELAHWVLALHRLTDYAAGTNVNVGVVQGGTTANTVAAEAVAQVDLRMSTLQEAERVEAAMQNLLENPCTPGIQVAVSGGITRPPMNPSPATLELCRAVDGIAAQLGIEFAWIATGGGSDANITAALGVPSIDGLGPIGSCSHTEAEYLEIDSIEPRLALLCEVIGYIAKKQQARQIYEEA